MLKDIIVNEGIFFKQTTAARGGVKIYSTGISNQMDDNCSAIELRDLRVVLETNPNVYFLSLRRSMDSGPL